MEFSDQIIRIGSDPGCDVCIRDASAIHATMSLSEGMLCMNLLEGNTAILNGFEVEGKYWLNQNDVLVIGNEQLDLVAIYQALNGEALVGTDNFYIDESDAVAIKRNWWGVALVVVILLGVMAVLGYNIYKYHEKRKAAMEVTRIQDSVAEAGQHKLDSLNQVLEQFE